MWAEGPAVHPAQGIALGNWPNRTSSPAQRANRSTNDWPVGPNMTGDVVSVSQGDALGWENCAPSGQLARRQELLPHPVRKSRSYFRL